MSPAIKRKTRKQQIIDAVDEKVAQVESGIMNPLTAQCWVYGILEAAVICGVWTTMDAERSRQRDKIEAVVKEAVKGDAK